MHLHFFLNSFSVMDVSINSFSLFFYSYHQFQNLLVKIRSRVVFSPNSRYTSDSISLSISAPCFPFLLLSIPNLIHKESRETDFPGYIFCDLKVSIYVRFVFPYRVIYYNIKLLFSSLCISCL